MTAATSPSITLETVSRMFRDRGVKRVFLKELAPNDNSKNQIYLGGDLSVLNVLPSGELSQETTLSARPGAPGKQILKALLPLVWVDTQGTLHPARNAQLILYPQYPEVRLSGFLQGSTIQLGEWLDPRKDGRAKGRALLLGVAADGRIYAHLAIPDSALRKQLDTTPKLRSFGALVELRFLEDDGASDLLEQLGRIHQLSWIDGKRLDATGATLPCNSPQCGGYTLEAELGITPNGYAEPDYLGWEVKSFTATDFDRVDAQTITLMTPEPDGGVYKDAGVETFVRRFGYADTRGRPDRLNFGGVHVFGKTNSKTRLRLDLVGFDASSRQITDVGGGIVLALNGEIAAHWTFRKLIDHWKRKHDKAAYVPNEARLGPPRSYRYGGAVQLGRGTDFGRLLGAVLDGRVYYDPGIKLEGASTQAPRIKRRSQFRIKARNLGYLYESLELTSL